MLNRHNIFIDIHHETQSQAYYRDYGAAVSESEPNHGNGRGRLYSGSPVISAHSDDPGTECGAEADSHLHSKGSTAVDEPL